MKVRLIKNDLRLTIRGFVEGEVYEAEKVEDDVEPGLFWYRIENPIKNPIFDLLSYEGKAGYGDWSLNTFEVVEDAA